MKVVIGAWVLGYRLSDAAVCQLAAAPDCGHMTRVTPIDLKAARDDAPFGGVVVGAWVVRDGHEYSESGDDAELCALRTCPALIRVVEALGPAATHPEFGGRVGVLEIPDDVAWHISNDDNVGAEHVTENHRTWHLPNEWEATS